MSHVILYLFIFKVVTKLEFVFVIIAELFALCLQRAREKLMTNNCTDSVGLEGSVEVIKLDLSRTFPHLGIFQQGGPYHSALDDLLSAYVCFRPDIGYVQVILLL